MIKNAFKKPHTLGFNKEVKGNTVEVNHSTLLSPAAGCFYKAALINKLSLHQCCQNMLDFDASDEEVKAKLGLSEGSGLNSAHV